MHPKKENTIEGDKMNGAAMKLVDKIGDDLENLHKMLLHLDDIPKYEGNLNDERKSND